MNVLDARYTIIGHVERCRTSRKSSTNIKYIIYFVKSCEQVFQVCFGLWCPHGRSCHSPCGRRLLNTRVRLSRELIRGSECMKKGGKRYVLDLLKDTNYIEGVMWLVSLVMYWILLQVRWRPVRTVLFLIIAIQQYDRLPPLAVSNVWIFLLSIMIHVDLFVLYITKLRCKSCLHKPRLCLFAASSCSHRCRTHPFALAAVLFLTPLLFPQLVASAADYTHHLLLSSYSSLQYYSISLHGIRSSHYHCLHCSSSTLGGAPRLNRLGERGVKMLPVNSAFWREPRN